MNRTDIELFKLMLQDDSIHFTVGTVTRVVVATDMSSVVLECTDIMNGNDLVCVQAFESIGAGTGSGDLPDVEDLVLIAFSLADMNAAYVIKRLPSKDEKLPLQMAAGHFVTKAKPGKNLYLSGTRIEIGTANPSSPCTEPLILGNQLKTCLANILTQLAQLSGDLSSLADQVKTLATDTANHTHTTTSPSGSGTAAATTTDFSGIVTEAGSLKTDAAAIQTQLGAYKSSPVNDGTLLSAVGFTEKGGS